MTSNNKPMIPIIRVMKTTLDGIYEFMSSKHNIVVYYSKSLLDKGIVIIKDESYDIVEGTMGEELKLLKVYSVGDEKYIDVLLLELNKNNKFSQLYIDLVLEKFDRLLQTDDEKKIESYLNYLGTEGRTFMSGRDSDYDLYFKLSFALLDEHSFNPYPIREVVYHFEEV